MARSMKILFRFDFGGKVGFGHLSRCRALAEALLSSGHEVHACGRNLQAGVLGESCTFLDDLPFLNFASHTETKRTRAETLSQSLDVRRTLDLARLLECDLVIVDNYEIREEWFDSWPRTLPVGVISDGVQYPRADFLIDYGFDASLTKYEESIAGGAKAVLGGNHALISDKYRKFERPKLPGSKSETRCLVTLGGSTESSEILRIQSLFREAGTNFRFIEAGQGLLGGSQVESEGTTKPCLPGSMVASFADSDLAIVSAGVTMYEFLASGSQGRVVLTAENQRPSFSKAIEDGLVRGSELSDLTSDMIVELLAQSFDVRAFRESWVAGRAIVDHHGPARAIHEVGLSSNYASRLRPIDDVDAPFILRLRNQDSSVEGFFSGHRVTPSEHLDWFDSFLADSGRGYIFELGALPVGHCRIEHRDGLSFLSYSILEQYQGRGLGVEMLRTVRALTRNEPPLRAEVKPTNEASLASLMKVGFVIEDQTFDKVVMRSQ